MQSDTRDLSRKSRTLAKLVLALALGLQLLHAGVVFLLPQASLASNIFQFCFPLLAAATSVRVGVLTRSAKIRKCWYSVGAAFLIWASAQALFIYYLYRPVPSTWSVRPDDALWVLFGFPLLLAVTTSTDEADRVAWLDRAQVLFFFGVLYLTVFLPASGLAVRRVYLIQNSALVLCCMLRLPVFTLARERRFFVRLATFLVTYTASESLGELLYRRGWTVGSGVDLVWTVPITLFLVLTARDLLQVEAASKTPGVLIRVFSTMQGLSIAVLAFLSMAVAALMAFRRPLLGGGLLSLGFLLFALRTNARERLWQLAHKKLEEAVLQDPLTGLGNRLRLRRSLTERLTASDSSMAALLFIDLDQFKQINDSLGHALGDRLLLGVATRLRDAAPSDSVLCRIGGDEFVVLTRAMDPEDAEQAAACLLDALQGAFTFGDEEVRCTASIGVVLAMPGEGADELLRTADHAMYRAKQLGRNRVQLFDASFRAEMSSRWQLEADLRDVVEQQGIQVAFQPIYSVEQGGICGFEALARWAHPKHGQIPPSQFITLAEDTGLILTLGLQILEKACSQIATWNRLWQTAFSVSVNVSPRQFADPGLIASLLSVLERTGLPPTLLRLEITETALLTHEAVVKRTLEQARMHGIRISLDDFGTGYSSLSFLLSLPVDEVKVDRSFVSHMHQDPDREELVRTVIHLGHSLGKRVVAEGVETEQDLLGLAQMGCECVQGYLISKPLSPEVLEADLSSISARRSSAATLEFHESLQGRKRQTSSEARHRTRNAEVLQGRVDSQIAYN